MAESTQPKTRFGGTILLTPGSGAAYTVKLEEGNLALSGLTAGQREAILVEDRGIFATLVEGKQKYISFSFSALLSDLQDVADTTLPSICLKTGVYALETSTLGANRPWAIDILWTMTSGGEGDHTLKLEDCRVEECALGEGDTNTVTISGIAYGPLTMT